MKLNVRNLILALASVGLVACGGENGVETPPEEVDEVECGANTIEVDGECVAAVECGEGETATNDGRCVFSEYCGEGTTFNPGPGRCEANANLSCGDQTSEEDGECVADFVIVCGEGTLVSDETCLPAEDVCGDGTDVDNQQQCRPVEDICGEGTAFDFTRRVCVPLSFLTCGPGTTEEDGQCIPSRIFYEDLAANFHLNLDEDGASTHFTLNDAGERFVFVGTIDEPEVEDDELLSNQDQLSFDAEAGQWLRIGLYSLGLPTPGFLLFNEDESFTRLSDLGGGVEVIRDVVIPQDDTYELVISSLSQLRDELEYVGGEDWHYVGYIEVIEAPEAQSIDIDEELFSGDIKDLHNNFYVVENMDAGSSLALVFDTLPITADGELQVWSDATTLEASFDLSENSLAFDAPGDPFYLLFDRAHAFGSQTGYSASGQTGSSLDEGDTVTVDVDLQAGEYIGIFQFNLEGAEISAAIKEGSTVHAETNGLNVSNAVFGQISLYWYASSDQTVTLEWENTTGGDLDFLATSHVVGEAEYQGGIDGDLVQFNSSVEIPRGHRHYVELEVEVDEEMAMDFKLSGFGDAMLTLYDADGETLVEGAGSVVYGVEGGTDLMAVEAITNMPSGFTLVMEETRTFTVSETNVAIPGNSVTSLNLTVPGGCIVESIEVYVLTTQGLWQDELYIDLIAPDSSQYRLVNPGAVTTSPIEFIFPTQNTPIDSLDGLIGEDGSGDWEVQFEYVWFSDATLAEWSLSVECE